MLSPDSKIHLQRWEEELASEVPIDDSACLAIFNINGTLVYANPTFQMFFTGEPAKNLISPTFDTMIGLPSKLLCYEGLLTIGDSETFTTTVNSRIWRKNDELLVLGKPDWFLISQQFTKMTRLNQEVNNLQRQLIKEKMTVDKTLAELKETQSLLVHSEKMNALGQLVAGVAHEINNPISFVSGNLYHLQSMFYDLKQTIIQLRQIVYVTENTDFISMADDVLKQFDIEFLFEDFESILKDSEEGIKRIKKIVENLRTFSRLGESECKIINLIPNLESTISLVRPELTKQAIRFTLEAPEELFLECYPSELNQVILNLIINSTQAVTDKGEISVKVAEMPDSVTIAVADNGCGIPFENKNKIFNPFFTTKPVGSGTGLGLSIAYKIVTDLHKGSLTFESLTGKGTTFFINLPKKQ